MGVVAFMGALVWMGTVAARGATWRGGGGTGVRHGGEVAKNPKGVDLEECATMEAWGFNPKPPSRVPSQFSYARRVFSPRSILGGDVAVQCNG